MPSDKPQNLFRSLDIAQSLIIYPKLRRNAEKHFKAAETLAGISDYANGIAHLILGSEELVKSFVILLQAYDFPVKKIANYDKLFTNHTARHNLLKEFYTIYMFISGVIQWPKWNAKRSTFENVVQVLLYGTRMVSDSFQNHIWWNEADKMKQNCFYLDYNSKGIEDPIVFDKKAFEVANDFRQKLKKDLRLMTLIIEHAQPNDLNELKQAFINGDMIEQIDESITRKRQ